MKGPVLLLTAALAVIALLALAGWARHRALVRGPGRFDGTLVRPDGRRRRVVGCYGPRRLTLADRVVPEHVLWRGERWRLEIERAPGGTAGRTLLHLADPAGGAEPVVLDVDEAVAGAVRAWAEAGSSMAGQSWWHEPGRG